MTKAPRYGSLPPCYGSIRHPHTRAENCCNDCPVEAPCDRLAEERGDHLTSATPPPAPAA